MSQIRWVNNMTAKYILKRHICRPLLTLWFIVCLMCVRNACISRLSMLAIIDACPVRMDALGRCWLCVSSSRIGAKAIHAIMPITLNKLFIGGGAARLLAVLRLLCENANSFYCLYREKNLKNTMARYVDSIKRWRPQKRYAQRTLFLCFDHFSLWNRTKTIPFGECVWRIFAPIRTHRSGIWSFFFSFVGLRLSGVLFNEFSVSCGVLMYKYYKCPAVQHTFSAHPLRAIHMLKLVRAAFSVLAFHRIPSANLNFIIMHKDVSTLVLT